jgi:hypothetical protein
MPRLVLLQDHQVAPLAEKPFLDEAALQRLLEEHPELIALDDVDPASSPLVPIGREVSLAGQSLDLLFLEASGRLTAVETKLWRNSEIRRTVVGQILEYAAHLMTWTVEDVERQAARYLADSRTPDRFRGQPLGAALASVSGTPTNSEEAGENALQAKIAEKLAARDTCLIIAVDRIVDSLRNTVAFVDSASQFRMFLLEVQEYVAADGMRMASIGFHGATRPRPGTTSGPRTTWDETRFRERLQSDSDPQSAAVVQDLYSFAQDEADSIIWGTGINVGSAAFGLRRSGSRFAVFGVTTKGEVWVSMYNLIHREVPEEARSSLLESLRSAGVHVRDDQWFTFQARQLADPSHLQSFKASVLGIRDSLG